MQIFENINIDFMGKRKYFYTLSTVLFLAGMISIAVRGLDFGIDFKGGSEIALSFSKPIETNTLRACVDKMGLGEVELKSFGSSKGVLVRTELQELPKTIVPKIFKNVDDVIAQAYPGLKRTVTETTKNSVTYQLSNADTTSLLIDKLFTAGYQAGKVSTEASNTQLIVRVGIADWIKQNLKAEVKDNKFTVLKEDRVGPKVGGELKHKAVIAIFLSLVGILVYLAFRFKFIFAFGAVVALFHDVLITLGLYALLYGVIPGLNLDITLTVIAAFLTLIGYSVQDTVVVFDRVREYLKLHKNMPFEENLNKAVNRTMSRTILTAGTVIIADLMLLIFGGEVLRAFAATIFFGSIIGTYSSVFVASALVLDYTKWKKEKIVF
jgi:preprotein translocase subunit SecF